MYRRRFPASWPLAATLLLAGCGPSTGGAGSPRGPAPDPSVLLPRLADPAFVYRDLGFFAKGEPLPFVASLRYLAGGRRPPPPPPLGPPPRPPAGAAAPPAGGGRGAA